MKNIKKIVRVITLILMAVVMMGCSVKKEEKKVVLPEMLNGQTFVYDELEHGVGTTLYTLSFSDSTYRLYMDNGVGITEEGTVVANADKTLSFENMDAISASYTGSAFEAPSVTFSYNGNEMKFTQATDTTEYVYLSYLGVYEGNIAEKPVVLILERWFEFYLYMDNTLIRGTYDIYEDGTFVFTTLDGEVFKGIKTFDETFSVFSIEIEVDIDTKQKKANDVVFTYAKADESYEAAHAMGAYTLRTYANEIFTIHGVDGLLKSMGTISFEEGNVCYFPRKITNDMELDEKFIFSFKQQEDSLIFPDSTYLLPRSGNIDEETGFGSYWSAGTALEFLKQQNTMTETEYVQILTQIVNREKTDEELFSNIPTNSKLLKPSMPSVDTAKPLVLLIDFSDYHRPRFVTAEGVEQALFDIEQKNSLSAYYYVSSYGNLTIDGTVLDWYRAEKNRDAYESDKEIMAEAIQYYIKNEGLQLSDYDADNDGEVDSLYVLWAGNLEDDGMWSVAYRSTWSSSPVEWECKVCGYIFVPGNTVWSSVPPLTCNLNSLTHETGHLLGLNDYYSYDTTDRNDNKTAYTGGALEGGIGGMDMMDANIGDHNAFSKWLLGWITPNIIEYEDIKHLNETDVVYTLKPSNETGDAIFIKLQSSNSLYTELLVIEVVSATRNANELTRLKEPVVRILHIDASLDEENLEGNWRSYGFRFDNSYTSTKFISLIEADGTDTSLNYLPSANGSKISYDMQDYFVAGDTLTPNTYPNTNGYDRYGNATIYNGLTIQVEQISKDGEATIRLGYEEANECLLIENVIPTPTIVPYTQGIMTTISKDTKEIIVIFDRELAFSSANAKEQIMVLSENQRIEHKIEKSSLGSEKEHVQSNYEIVIDNNMLKICFKQELMANQDYTIVIPSGILCEKGNRSVVNNYNSIYGFVVEK